MPAVTSYLDSKRYKPEEHGSRSLATERIKKAFLPDHDADTLSIVRGKSKYLQLISYA